MPARLRALRACAPLISPISAVRSFLSCVVVLIADFIPLKVIKIASNVIDFHLYDIMINNPEKNKYSEEPKTALVRPIFHKNERNKQCINY